MHDIKLAVDLGKVDGFFVSRKLSLLPIIFCFYLQNFTSTTWGKEDYFVAILRCKSESEKQ